MLTGGGMRSRSARSWARGVSLTETFTKPCPASLSLQKAPFMLEGLPGKGATFPNPQEGSSLPSQNKEAAVGNAAVPAAIAQQPTRAALGSFPWKTRHSQSSFWGLQRANVGFAPMDGRIPGAPHKRDGPWAQKRCKKSSQRQKTGMKRTKWQPHEWIATRNKASEGLLWPAGP